MPISPSMHERDKRNEAIMRMRTTLAISAATCALALAGAVAPATAAVHPNASTVLTVGSAGGAAVNPGDALTASLASGTKATFFSSSGGTSGVTCTTSTFNATDTTNPAAPGTATESVTSQTFSNCTSNVTGVTSVKSITVTTPFTVQVSDSSGDPVTIPGPVTTTVSLGTLLGTTTCQYTGSNLSGSASNSGNSITFTSQHFTKTSGSSLCFSDAYWTAKYAPVTDTTQGGPVFVN
jgi:hypothetical protein